MKHYFYRPRLTLFLLPFVVACQAAPTQPISVCSEFDLSENVDPTVLRTALIHAAEWSCENYGEECVVCADFARVNGTELRIHITSPIEVAVLNTSALLSYRVSDGSFLSGGKSHSCYAWRRPK